LQLTCVPEETHYGIDYNATRNSLGLSQISNDFELSKKRKFYEIWENKKCNNLKTKSCLIRKKIMYPKGILSSEIDEYVGTAFYKTIDGTFKEKLYWTYHYTNSKGKAQWEYTLFDQTSVDEGFLGKKIDREQALAILKKWNITR